jgi:hypothetical protein
VFGTAALRDAWRFGATTGAACAASCAPIMLLVLAASDLHLIAMAGATVLLTLERYRPARPPRWRLPLIRLWDQEHIGVRSATRGLGPVAAMDAHARRPSHELPAVDSPCALPDFTVPGR